MMILMNLFVKVKRGEGPVFRLIKQSARRILQFHIPVTGTTKPIFRTLYGAHVLIREGWNWLVRFFWYEPLFRSQCQSIGTRFRMELLPYIVGTGRITLGSGVRLSGKASMVFSNRNGLIDPELSIGDDSFVGHGCNFSVASSVQIGSHCLIAGGAQIQDHDGHPLDAARRSAGEPSPAEAVRPVVIGNHVWIGAGAVILKGVTIGDRVVVGARAVVTRDVPPDVVVTGNPARIVKHLAMPLVDAPDAVRAFA
ncbi:MAG: maa 2 [Phycisphaerales bacterium]|nr:maa 2 [Phycisphaerales bacterium]